MKQAAVVFAAVLAGCVTNTGVLQMGKDTYTTSAGASASGSVSGNDVNAKQAALTVANEFCAKQNKEINVQNIGGRSSYGGSTSDIVFQCVSADEAALAMRPVFRKEPDTVIENRAR